MRTENPARNRTRGVTLMEVLISMALLSLLAVGIMTSMRVGLSSLEKANSRLMENRRVANTQKILEQEIAGLLPATAVCAGGQAPQRILFFQGEPESMRFVSTYSLQEAWRGAARILEFQVVPRDDGPGVRLVVNELPYSGPLSTGQTCVGLSPDPVAGGLVPRFRPVEVGPQSYILADKLESCRFAYLEPARPPLVQQWKPRWVIARWPLAVRIEIAVSEEDATRLRPVTITAPVHVNRSPDIQYADYMY